ncbi:hypothetical protein SAMN02745136_05167 [Anaerocolumna jejuensis DSM 15929]|uniref:Uncharacterized protein n=1 Tax=Anaerocolumna jejuensis DSM 15929 TaxID=1121322 RepID=A0A1M7BKT3_9FIRM|nr:hypothetical protein [Anaerocolumna jejuensis]SHL55523.1 hypothetical protein SAMN02745136_05167 [Anaerocolumna jejuensis DSM 15929]
MSKYYKKDNCFPNEIFIQEAIEHYFLGYDFIINASGHVDLIAEKENEKWIIEAKGLTSSVGVDFNTCLGQLIKSMKDSKTIYAIAVPKIDSYKRQCEMISDYFRKLVGLHILVVDRTGNVSLILPNQPYSEIFN